MIDDFESHGKVRSSVELWSEICSSLPGDDIQQQDQGAQFNDSFQPTSQEGITPNGVSRINSSESPWEPMADSDVYIASLENRLRRIKGQSSEVSSREMLRSLSQAKQECWDRFLHEAQSSDLFRDGSNTDQSALEYLKRWLLPDRVAISAEELEYLLLPSQNLDQVTADRPQSGPDEHADQQDPEEDEGHIPEK